MLKGKNTMYYMVPINILIWGYVGVKIYSAFSENESVTLVKNPILSRTGFTDTSQYAPSFNYDDPFLKAEQAVTFGKLLNPEKKEPAIPKKKIEKSEEKKKEIKYLGIISNTEKGTITVLVTIDGRSHILKKGDVADGVKLEMITKDNLTLRSGKEKIIVQKS